MYFGSPLSRPHTQASSICSSMESIFDALSELSVALCHSHISSSRRLSFSNNLYLVEHALHSLPQDAYSPCYYEPRRIAAMIYIYRFLRQIPQTAGIYQILLNRLQTSVSQCISRNSPGFSSRLSDLSLLWICFIGAATSKLPDELEGCREWWIGLLRNICRGLHVVSGNNFEICLNRVVEMGSLCREACNTIWREIDNSNHITGEDGLK